MATALKWELSDGTTVTTKGVIGSSPLALELLEEWALMVAGYQVAVVVEPEPSAPVPLKATGVVLNCWILAAAQRHRVTLTAGPDLDQLQPGGEPEGADDPGAIY